MWKRYKNVFYMLLSTAAVVLAVSGIFELDFMDYVGAAIAVFAGLEAIFYLVKRKDALKSDVLTEERVMEFYRYTQRVWASGALDEYGKHFAKEGKWPLDKFTRKYLPIEGNIFHAFFTEFPAREKEYLLVVGIEEDEKKEWFLLTNQRWIQRDGLSKEYREMVLDDIENITVSGRGKKTLMVDLKSGRNMDFQRARLFPEGMWDEEKKQVKRVNEKGHDWTS